MNVKELFDKIADLPTEQREKYLDDHCAGDAALRAAITDLLSAHDRVGSFLGEPTVASPATQAADAPAVVQSVLPAERQIGPYKLLEMIGEGGFGTVYMAEQERPVRRRVALKIIKLGMDTKQVVARFEAERQALAIMNHPNIAQVFDAGATSHGRPYFVMELVRGEPITRYCDVHRLSQRQRLELFIPVCYAVQHAHQKGVIHRDIKPNNVLVTMHDGTPVPKVIDFGIAKATQAKLTDKTLFTEFKQMIGTPEYMAPEQAELSELDVDTRADVYSLGVLLYELITGATPFDAKELRSKTFVEMQRMIREVDPPRPSTRLSTLASDLDWVVMKCLEKDRTRRYESASALAADVERFLAGDAVLAHPPATLYLVSKFAHRHGRLITAAAALVTVLLSAVAVSSVLLVRARRAETLAHKRLDDVSREAAKSQAINSFLNGMLSAADPFQPQAEGDLTVRQMLDRAAKRIDDGALSDQPEINAAVRGVIGRSFQSLGRAKEATEQLRRALDERRRAVGAGRDDVEVATLLNLLGMALADQDQLDEAERVTRQAMEMRQRVLSPDSPELADSFNNLATIELDRGSHDEAIRLFRRALEISHARRAEPIDLATQMSGLAVALLRTGKADEAETLYRDALKIEEQALGADYPGRAVLLSNLASLLIEAGRLDQAETAQREALRIMQKSLPPGHPDTAQALNGLANILRGQGKTDDATAMARQVVDLEKSARGPKHPQVAMALRNLAQMLSDSGHRAEAIRALNEALEIARASRGDDATDPLTAEIRMRLGLLQLADGDNAAAEPNLRKAYLALHNSPNVEPLVAAGAASQYAAALQAMNRVDEAEPIFREALDALRRVAPRQEALRSTLFNYWSIVIDRGRIDEAGDLANELLKLSTDATGRDSRDTMLAETRVAYVLAKRGECLDEAEMMMRHVLASPEKLQLPEWVLQNQRGLLGEILLKRGKIDEAAPFIREAYDVISASPAAIPRAKRDARERMTKLLERTGSSTAPTTRG